MLKLCVWRDGESWALLELKEGQCLFSLGFYTVIHNSGVTGKAQSLCPGWTPASASTGWLNLRHSRNGELFHISKTCICFCVPFSSLVCKKKPIVLIATYSSFYFLFTCVGRRMNCSELPDCSINMPQAKQWLQTLPWGTMLWPLRTGLRAGDFFLQSYSVVVSGLVFSVPKNCPAASPSHFTCPRSRVPQLWADPPRSQSVLLKAV